jgi:hypothetical protein
MSDIRNKLRAAIFDKTGTADTQEVEFFGQNLEIRQPPVGEVLDAADSQVAGTPDSPKIALIKTLIRYCFVPGSGERVFEEADAENLMQLPWGPDFLRLQEAINKLTGITQTAADDAAKK